MNFDYNFYRALVLRRLPVMSLFVLVCAGMGIVTALKLPETFSTSARLLVESPQIPDSMIPSTVRAGAEEQLAVIEQRLMTRANMIDIANRFNVFEDIRSMEPDRAVQLMREATRISRRSGPRAGNATTMMITFEARAPQIAANVVNSYVTLVLQENSRFRVSRAESTLDFFQQEVNLLDSEMTRVTVDITEFKTVNADALPQDRDYKLRRESLLQERIERLSRELSLAMQQRENLELRIEVAGVEGPRQRTELENEILVVEAELDRLNATYSDTHPQVIRLTDRLAQLQVMASAQSVGTGAVDDSDASPQQRLQQAALDEADSRIEAIQAQIDATKTELNDLALSIPRTTANNFQLAEMERELAIIQSRYNAAVNNLNAARMSERVEATAQGQRVTVIENASVPQIPSGPNRIAIAAIGIFSGIALAVGYFALLEFLNRSIRRPSELEDHFDITPIAAIPYMEGRTERLFRRSGLVMAMVAVMVGVPAVLWYVDTTYLPLEVIVQKAISELGLG